MSSEATTLTLPYATRPRRTRWLMVARVPAVQAWFALALLAAISTVTVVVAAGEPTFLSAPVRSNYFPTWLAGPFAGSLSGVAPEETLKWLFSGGVLLSYGAYLLLLRRYRALSPAVLWTAVLALQLIYLLGPPLSLTDVFNYINYARMEVVHHLNPYVTMPVLEPHSDPAFPLSNWHGLLSPYGPLFTIFTFLFVPLSVAAYLWTYKLALLLADGGLIFLSWLGVRRLGGDGRKALVWVGLNPIVLVWGVGADHNDFFTMVVVVGGCYALLRAQQRRASETLAGLPAPLALAALAGALIALSGFFKASAAVVLPIALCAILARRDLVIGLLGGALAGGLVGLAATLIAFGPHFPDLAVQGSLVTALSIPNLAGLALGQGGEIPLLHDLFTVVLVVAVLWCARSALRRREWMAPAGWASLAVVATLSWVLPWYVIWILPFCALARSRALARATLLLGLYLIISWLPVTSQLMALAGFHPQQTAVGREHGRVVAELLNP